MKNSIQNPEKGIALYYQVENSIREKIENGEWKVGQKLPTEPELCQFFGVSRTTIRQAVDSLVSAGLLAKKQGSGTYVTQATTARNHLNFLLSASTFILHSCKAIWSIVTKIFF